MLTQPITIIPRVGRAKAELAAKLDLRTVGDILQSYPRTYKDFTTIISPEMQRLAAKVYFLAGWLILMNGIYPATAV